MIFYNQDSSLYTNIFIYLFVDNISPGLQSLGVLNHVCLGLEPSNGRDRRCLRARGPQDHHHSRPPGTDEHIISKAHLYIYIYIYIYGQQFARPLVCGRVKSLLLGSRAVHWTWSEVPASPWAAGQPPLETTWDRWIYYTQDTSVYIYIYIYMYIYIYIYIYVCWQQFARPLVCGRIRSLLIGSRTVQWTWSEVPASPWAAGPPPLETTWDRWTYVLKTPRTCCFGRQQSARVAARCAALRCAKARAWKQNQRTTDRTCF